MRFTLRQLIVMVTIVAVVAAIIGAVNAWWRKATPPSAREIALSRLRAVFRENHDRAMRKKELRSVITGRSTHRTVPTETQRWLVGAIEMRLHPPEEVDEVKSIDAYITAIMLLEEKAVAVQPPWAQLSTYPSGAIEECGSFESTVTVKQGTRNWTMLTKQLCDPSIARIENTADDATILQCSAWWTKNGWSAEPPQCPDWGNCMVLRVDFQMIHDAKMDDAESLRLASEVATPVLSSYEDTARALKKSLDEIP